MSTITMTIGELAVKIHSAGLGGSTVDTAVAAEFDVEVEFTYRPGHPGRLTGPMDMAEEPLDPELDIIAIKASANVHFAGDTCETIFKRGSELLPLFTGREVDQLADRILSDIESN